MVLGSMRRTEGRRLTKALRFFHEAQEYSSLLEVVCFAQEEFNRTVELSLTSLRRGCQVGLMRNARPIMFLSPYFYIWFS